MCICVSKSICETETWSLLPAATTDEEQAFQSRWARHDLHLHRHLEYGSDLYAHTTGVYQSLISVSNWSWLGSWRHHFSSSTVLQYHSFEDTQARVLAREDRCFEKGVKETIHVKLEKTFLNRGGWLTHFLSPTSIAVLYSLRQRSKHLHIFTRSGN